MDLNRHNCHRACAGRDPGIWVDQHPLPSTELILSPVESDFESMTLILPVRIKTNDSPINITSIFRLKVVDTNYVNCIK